jgi:virulence-associated protein VapD
MLRQILSIKLICKIAYDISGRNLYRHHLLETQGQVFMIDSNDRKQIYEAQKKSSKF